MLAKLLSELGLDSREAEAYLAILSSGKLRSSDLAKRLGVPRSTAQNTMLRLEQEGVVVKIQEKNAFVYSALHPENLIGLIESRKRQSIAQYDTNIAELKKLMPQLTSTMYGAQAIPQVQFFRGLKGVREVLFDTLNSSTELKDFANIDAMFAQIKEVNDDYVAAREKTSITKRSLLLDTPFARQVYESGAYSPLSHKGYKWISSQLYPFSIEMNIYDGKVSYLTYVEGDLIGVIIQNDHIFQMHESMWRLIWDLLPGPK